MNQINLDINKSGQIINEPVVLRVGEKDQTITVNLLKDGQPYTSFTTATFFANKPSGAIVANDPANISNGVITYTVPQALVSEFGKITNAYFLIDGKVSTEGFVIAVLQGVNISDDLNDYIPGMDQLNVIYDKWKDKLQTITDEMAGIDAPKEVKNVIDNELKNYTDQINELQRRITATEIQLNDLKVPEISARNLIANTRTLDGAAEIGNVSLNGFQNCAVVTNPYTNKFPVGNFYNALSVYPTVKCDKGDYTITFIAWADNDGDMIANYFFSSDTITNTAETSQGIISNNGDGSSEITLTTGAKLYWIKWHNNTDGEHLKQIILGRVMDKFSNGHTNKGKVHIGLPMLVNGSIPLPWMPAPEDVQTDISNAVVSKVSKGDVTNENILPYSGYWSDTTGWTLLAGGASDQSLGLINHGFYHNGVDATLYINTSQKAMAAARSSEFTLLPNTAYTFSFLGFAAVNSAGTNVSLLGRSYTSTSDYDFAHSLFPELKISYDGINKYTATFKTGPTETLAYIRLENAGSNDGHSATSYFAELKLEQGDIATPYTRVSSSEFSSVSKKVEELEAKIDKLSQGKQ